MPSLEELFRGIREGFTPRPGFVLWGLAALAGLLVLAILRARVRRYRRKNAEIKRFAQWATDHQIAGDDRDLLVSMALRVRLEPMDVATQAFSFERATALELRAHAPTLVVRDDDVFGRIQRLRRALGFHHLPESFPLLSTRQLSPLRPVDLLHVPATVGDVTEAFFSVQAPETLALQPGIDVALSLTHGHEARYDLCCRLLATAGTPSGPVYIFAHDENPSRVQLRDTFRVEAHLPVQIRPITKFRWSPRLAVLPGTLTDISVGGVAVETKAESAIGAEVLLSFEWGESRFSDVKAQVLECHAGSSGMHHTRLKFCDLSPQDEHRLAAAIAHHSARSHSS